MPGTQENPDMSVKERSVSTHQSFRVCKGIEGGKGKTERWISGWGEISAEDVAHTFKAGMNTPA